MTREGVRDLADRVARPLLGEHAIERIEVSEESDWSGDPSIFVEVFVMPGTPALDGDQSIRLLRTFSDALVDGGEHRLGYVRVRHEDEGGEVGDTR